VGVGAYGEALYTAVVTRVSQEPDGTMRYISIQPHDSIYPSSVGPWIDIGQDTRAARDVNAMMQTSKTGLLSKLGPDPQGHVASFLTGLEGRRSLGAHLSAAATKMGRPGVKGARRNTRRGNKKSRKAKKTRKH
jgi:hypothetical protein